VPTRCTPVGIGTVPTDAIETTVQNESG